MRNMIIGLVIVAAAGGLAGCGEDDPGTAAEQACRAELEQRLGEDGVVSIEDVEENSSGVLTKVEASLVYREQRGAGDRVETWFTCQLEGSGDDVRLTTLTIHD